MKSYIYETLANTYYVFKKNSKYHKQYSYKIRTIEKY